MGPDFNGDGKHDWQDDAIFHNIIEKEDGKQESTQNQPGPTVPSGRSGWISTIVALAYLSVLLPGDIPINGFTMFIGLICAGILVVKILGWLYR